MPRAPPRSVRKCVLHRFTAFARTRGETMVRRGGVRVRDATDVRLVVDARDGPGPYAHGVAELCVRPPARSGVRELEVVCTCSMHAMGLDACRHAWAALVLADRIGALAALHRASGDAEDVVEIRLVRRDVPRHLLGT